MTVKIYSTPSCGYCTKAKSYFRERGIRFKDINIALDRRRAEEIVHKTGQQGVPVIEINGKMIVGFDIPKIEQLIRKYRGH